MLNRLVTLVPLALAVLLTGCAGQAPQQDFSAPKRVSLTQEPSQKDLAALNDGYRLPALLERLARG